MEARVSLKTREVNSGEVRGGKVLGGNSRAREREVSASVCTKRIHDDEEGGGGGGGKGGTRGPLLSLPGISVLASRG